LRTLPILLSSTVGIVLVAQAPKGADPGTRLAYVQRQNEASKPPPGGQDVAEPREYSVEGPEGTTLVIFRSHKPWSWILVDMEISEEQMKWSHLGFKTVRFLSHEPDGKTVAVYRVHEVK